MSLLTRVQRALLRTNAIAHRAAVASGGTEPDPVPVVRLFNPCGAATWLATELAEDGDTLFGLADLGFGCPELGYFSVSEIEAVRLPFGLRIERDQMFRGRIPLSAYAEAARTSGSIVGAERLLRTVLQTVVASRLPGPSEEDGAG